ncbi:hypothetical protein BDQ12DRAFT_675122 [Crucibulum laeve]|uniref:AAA+ ATPase domain-containing protein n=1 Tax=Crucibulum laeve TaxID=68775 RepID=A0A5C3MF37_9AGAR|nr:hypothetical protein BDQ12DRAFT_675122 [Crucibulum laeve]
MAEKKKKGEAVTVFGKGQKVKPVPSRQKTLFDHFTSKKEAESAEEAQKPLELDIVVGKNGASRTMATTGTNLSGNALPIFVNDNEERTSGHLLDDASTRDSGREPSTQSISNTLLPNRDGPRDEDIIQIVEPEMPLQPESGQKIISVVASQANPEQPAVEGGSRYKPIVIGSSPIKPTLIRSSAPSQRIHSLFLPRPKKTTSTLKAQAAQLDIAPYPSKELQHVKGSQTSTPVIPYPLRRAPKAGSSGVTDNHAECLAFLKLNNESTHAPPHPPRHTLNRSFPSAQGSPQAIPQEYLHPAISRVTHTSLTNISSMPSATTSWAEKWHPRLAQEVLGNEDSATYLRDWLRALAVQFTDIPEPEGKQETYKQTKLTKQTRGVKRSRVVREVSKRKGRKKLRIDSEDEGDHWIVNSDESEDDGPVSGMEDDGLLISTLPNDDIHADQEQSAPAPQFNQLHNTILLVGPPGSGKTAAVYACAEELGWDVFEVYPGIGKRSGSNVDILVGEVGKNHLVGKTKGRDRILETDSKAAKSLAGFLSKAKKSEGIPASHGLHDETTTHLQESHPDTSEIEPVASSSENDPSNQTLSVRQSVILLEEVDILFKEDVNFWPAVIKLIKECKRPVICTCNDLSLVPYDDLPLQNILYIQPCQPFVATSYLQRLCSAEGYALERDFLEKVYVKGFRSIATEISGCSNRSWLDDLPKPDLRQAIHALQFWCSTGERKRAGYNLFLEANTDSLDDLTDWTWVKTSGDMDALCGAIPEDVEDGHDMKLGTLQDLRTFANHTDFISYMDSHLVRSPTKTPEALEYSTCIPSNDDEIGHHILFDSTRTDSSQFGLHDYDTEIASVAISLSRGSLEAGMARGATSIHNSLEASLAFRDCKKFRNEAGEILAKVCPRAVTSTFRTSLYTDYLPWIRHMVAADDMQESIHIQNPGRGGRTTRNSGCGYIRMISLTEEGRAALTASALEDI